MDRIAVIPPPVLSASKPSVPPLSSPGVSISLIRLDKPNLGLQKELSWIDSHKGSAELKHCFGISGALDLSGDNSTVFLGEKLRFIVIVANTTPFRPLNNVQVRITLRNRKPNSIVLESSALKSLSYLSEDIKAHEGDVVIDDPLNAFVSSSTPEDMSKFKGKLCAREFPLQFSVAELGLHQVICRVSYDDVAGNKTRSEAQYKFTATKAVKLLTSVNSVQGSGQWWIASLEVTNICDGLMTIESIDFTCLSGLKSIDLNKIKSNPLNMILERNQACMFHFKVFVDPTASDASDLSKGLGRFDLRWRRQNCDKGQVQTQILKVPDRSSSFVKGLDMYVISIPQKQVRNVPFPVVLKVVNPSDTLTEPLSFILQLSKGSMISGIGNTSKKVERIPSQGSVLLTFELIGSVSGLHSIPPFGIRDSSGVVSFFDSKTQVLITEN